MKEEYGRLTRLFKGVKDTMEELNTQKAGIDKMNDKSRATLLEEQKKVIELKKRLERARKCCCVGGKFGAGGAGGAEWSNSVMDLDGCPMSTLAMREKARTAIANLKSREDEHCTMAKSRITCGKVGPSCPCGSSMGMRLEMTPPCGTGCNKGMTTGAPGATPAAAPAATPAATTK